MNFRITLKQLLIGICILMCQTHLISQEKTNRKLKIGPFAPVSVVFGQNVYKSAHKTLWTGIGFEGQMNISPKWYAGLQFWRQYGQITQHEIINAKSTIFKSSSIIVGYEYKTLQNFILDYNLLLGLQVGENQGEFNGYSVGLGLKGTQYFDNKYYLFLSSDFHRYHFNIKASSYWEPRFNQTYVLRVSFGGGLIIK